MRKGRYLLIEVNDEILNHLRNELKGIAKVFQLKEAKNFRVIRFKVDKKKKVFEVVKKNKIKTVITSGSLKKIKRIAKAKSMQKEV